ncbi:hypothetical protein TcCL_Unassigned03487, partial [Trypanosoma cruzi]
MEPSPPVTTTATAVAPATTPVIAERTLAAAGSVFDAMVKDPSSTPLQPPDITTASQRQPVHVQRTAQRQSHAANHQHANSVAEHSRHLRARDGQHTPRQIHVVQHEARGGVAKVVGAAVHNTRLCNQHRVHHSDAR